MLMCAGSLILIGEQQQWKQFSLLLFVEFQSRQEVVDSRTNGQTERGRGEKQSRYVLQLANDVKTEEPSRVRINPITVINIHYSTQYRKKSIEKKNEKRLFFSDKVN